MADDFRSRLDGLIALAGMSNRALERASGVREATIRNLRSGSNRPNTNTVDRLAKAFGVPADVLLGYAPIPLDYAPLLLAEQMENGPGRAEVLNSQLILQAVQRLRLLQEQQLEVTQELVKLIGREADREAGEGNGRDPEESRGPANAAGARGRRSADG